jgi:hypothetical protein
MDIKVHRSSVRTTTKNCERFQPYTYFIRIPTHMCWESVFIKRTSNHRRSTAWHKFRFWRKRISLNSKVHGYQLILCNNQSLSRETWLYCPKLSVERITQKAMWAHCSTINTEAKTCKSIIGRKEVTKRIVQFLKCPQHYNNYYEYM